MALLNRLRRYERGDFKADLLAGLTVAVVLVPQAMAYALLAGVPPVLGLYAASVPVFLYAWIGTSRHMAIGPVAIVSLLIASGLGDFAEPGSEEYIGLAILLSFMVGVCFLLLGLVRAGFLVNFISHPTILGFNAAAAILTAGSQLPVFFGIPKSSIGGLAATWPWPTFLHLGSTHWLTAAIAAGALALLVGMRKFTPKLPAYLLVCVLGTLLSWLLDFETAGVAIVGDIPTGMPAPALPDLDFERMANLVPVALSIVVVGYASSITVVKALAAKERDAVRPNRELWAFGFANLASGLFGAFPVSAGLARTTVAAQSGARTQATGIVAAITVVVVLFLLAPVFRYLPQPVLAAIIIMAASRLVDVRGSLSVFRTKRNDGLTALLAFVATLALGLEEGLAVGLLMALVFFVARSTRPHTAELGRIPGSMVYRNTKRFDVETCPQVGILRIDAPLYYANARFLEDRINEMFAERPQMSLLALDCASVNDMDATAIKSLERVVEGLRARGSDLHLIAVIGPVRDLLDRSGLGELIGEANMHRSLLEAAPIMMALISRDTCESRCRAAAFPDCSLIPRRSEPSDKAKASRFSPQI